MAENVLPFDGKPEKGPDDPSSGVAPPVTSPDPVTMQASKPQDASPAVELMTHEDRAVDNTQAKHLYTAATEPTRETEPQADKEVHDRPIVPPSTWFPPRLVPPPTAAPSGTLSKIFSTQESHKIFDLQFQRAHRRLADLAAFAGQLSKPLVGLAAVAARLGPLNTLKFTGSPTGRDATDAEWIAVEERTQQIWSVLTDVDRRRFNSTQVPASFTTIVMIFLALAILSVGWAYGNVVTIGSTPPILLWAFLAFVVASGAMGATASIGMNALSVQDDATFDLSVRKFLWLRVSLGALFGTLLTLPWAFPVFQVFVQDLGKIAKTAPTIQAEQLQQAAWLLSPFVLGFSTSLVILVLTRMVEAVQTIFGKSATK